MRRMILPASLLLALSSFAMAAPIYKWVDAEGVTVVRWQFWRGLM